MQCPRCKKEMDASRADCPRCGVNIARWLGKDEQPVFPALPEWLRLDKKRIANPGLWLAGGVGLLILVGVFWLAHRDTRGSSLQQGRTVQGAPPSVNDAELIRLIGDCHEFMGEQTTTLPNGFDARLFSDTFETYPFLSQAIGGGLVVLVPPLEPDQKDAGPFKWTEVRITRDGAETIGVTEPFARGRTPAAALAATEAATAAHVLVVRSVHVPMRFIQRFGEASTWDDSETFRVPFWWTFGNPSPRDGWVRPLLLGNARIVGKDPHWRVEDITVNLGGRESKVRCGTYH